jgi:hypothetical protein
VVHIASVHEHEYSSTRFCVSEVKQLFEQNCIEKQVFNGTFKFKKSNCEKDHCRGRLSFKTQLKIEYLLPYTGSSKVLENFPGR